MGRRQEEEERRRGPTWGSSGRRSFWPAALLAAAVLSSSFVLAQAQAQEVPVTAEPSLPLEGQDVTLTPGGKPTFIACVWYRGEEAEPSRIFTYFPSSPPEQLDGAGFTGRETGGPGCSLHIGSLALNNTGDYVVTKIVRGGTERGRAHIGVSAKPVLWPAELFVEEHANVTLNCTTSEHSGIAISWFKDGKAVPAKAVLSERNRTLTVTDISRDDEGMYTCEAWNRVYSAMSNPSKIAVRQLRSPLAAGAVSAIVLGSLAAAALAGTPLYCFFRAQRRKNKSSKQMNPTSPVYENAGPSAQAVPVNSSETNHTYEELQHGSQAVYDQLRW